MRADNAIAKGGIAKGGDSHYEMLLNAIPSPVLLVGRDLRVTLANRDFMERSRRTREDTLDRRLPEVFPPAIVDHTRVVRHIQSVFETNKPVTGERITFPAPGGLTRIYYYRVLPLPDRDNVEFVILVMEDVTERERLSEDIRRMEAQLLQAQKLAALGVMAGGIAHELRNPLAVCSSAAQFLMQEQITPIFRRECAQKVRQAIQRSSDIIDHLLKFMRPSERGSLVKLNLLAVLRETLALIANQACIQNINVESRLPDAPAFVQGDTHLLQQVFMNLFLNALHAMPSGGRLNVSARTTLRRVIVRVADSGPGIPEVDLGGIFDPFHSKSGSGTGTGLGLPLCHAIIEQHAGTIEVNSPPGKGATFTVRLDLAAP
jgi:PAS domain S-box-containing protein